MSTTRSQGALVGGLMLAAGLGYLYLTAHLPRRGPGGASFVDATFVPYILALLMVALGALQFAAGLRASSGSSARFDPDAEPEGGKASYRTVAVTLALVAGFAATLRPFGFPVVAAVYLFLQFIVLTPNDRTVSYPLYAGLAVVCSLVIFVTFRYGFQLLLPAGPLTPFLP